MSFSFSSILTEVETVIGVVKVDVNAVVAKAAAEIQLVGHELDALLKWTLSQAGTIQNDLNAAAPVISTIGAIAATAASGNPAAGAAVSAAINGVNEALAVAEASVKAMNDANAAMNAAHAQGALVSDTAAIAAGVQSIVGTNSHVATLMNAAVSAAKTINALIAQPSAPAPAGA